MNCTYSYENQSADSLQKLLAGIFGQIESGSIKDKFIQSVSFFNADGEQVQAAVNDLWEMKDGKWTKKKKLVKGKGVKETIKTETQYQSRFSPDGNTDIAIVAQAEDYVKFANSLGIAFHKCLEMACKVQNFIGDPEYDKAFLELKALIETKRGRIDWNKVSTYMPNSSVLQMFVSACLNNPSGLSDAINNAVKQTKNLGILKGMTLMNEVPISYQINGKAEVIDGVIDLLAYDQDGNVVIVDFKTTAGSDLSSSKRFDYATQIEFYKQMLIKSGFPKDKIKTYVIKFTFGANGDNPHMSTELIPSETLLTTDKQSIQQRNIIRTYFPREGAHISTSEYQEREARLQSKLDDIITPTQKKKSAIQVQRKFIKKAVDNNNEIMVYSLQNDYGNDGLLIHSWEVNGENIKGFDIQGRQRLNTTIDQLAQDESEALEKSLKARTELISDILRQKSFITLTSLYERDQKRLLAIKTALEPYMSDNWEECDIQVLKDRNIITMYNHATQKYSFIIMSDFVSLVDSRYSIEYEDKGETKRRTLRPNETILSSIITDHSLFKQYREFKEIPMCRIQDHLTLEALLTIQEYADVIEAEKPINIDRVQVVSAVSGVHSLGTDLNKHVTALRLIEHNANKTPNKVKNASQYTNIYSTWQNKFTLTDEVKSLCDLLVNRIAAYQINNPTADSDFMSSIQREVTLENVHQLMQDIKHTYPGQYSVVTEDVGRIYKTCQQVYETLKRDEVFTDIYKQTRFGLTGSEIFGAGIDLLRYGESRRFSFNGMIVSGMAQGLDNSVSYASSDQEIRYFQQLLSQASQQINVETINLATEVNAATKEFLRQEGKLGVQTAVIGNTNDSYEKLYEHANGKIAGSMSLQDPYGSNNLADHQREYIGCILWNINRLRFASSSILTPEVRSWSYAELKQHKDIFEEYQHLVSANANYRYVPLKRKDGTKGLITSFQMLFNPDTSIEEDNKRLKKFFGRMLERWNQSIEPVLLSPEQKQLQDRDIKEDVGEFTYHSPYNLQGQHRVDTLSNNDMRDWETNLNFLAIEYASAQFKEVYYQKLLATVGNQLGELQMVEIMTGQDLKDTKQALINRVKVSIYNKDLIPDELKTQANIVGGIKQAVSLCKIAARPALFVKEMVLGTIKNLSTTWAKYFVNDTTITFTNLMEAAALVYTNGAFSENAGKMEGETFGDFRLINSVNNLYRINDRDMNVLGDSLSYDHHGMLNWGTRMLYLNTTSPDWFNRMMLLIAKMKADGSWEAHTMKDGKLVYNARKDDRYKEFLDFYTTHKSLKNEPMTESYRKSKALYKLKIQQLTLEGWEGLSAGENGIYSTNLPVAYTQQEMDSFKEQVGMFYGYYSHDERTNVQKSLGWLLHTQFLTFLPGEIRKYLASGNFESAVGKTVHQIDPVTKEKLYYKTVEGELTEIVKESELSPEDRSEPVYEFTYTPVEGLLVSTLKTVHDVIHRDFDPKEKPEQWNRTKLFLFNQLLAMLIAGIFMVLTWMGIDAKKEAKGHKMMQYAIDTTNRVVSEMNMLNTLVEPLGNIGIQGTDFMGQTVSSVASVMTNDNYEMLDAANSIFAQVKDLHLTD